MNDTIALDWASPRVRTILGGLLDGGELSVNDGIALTEVAGRDFAALTLVADEMRRRQAGDVVTYVVNRNINFTNVCIKHCTFCAFSRDHREEEGYFLPMDEVVRRAIERGRWARPNVHPGGPPAQLEGSYYLDLCRAIKAPSPRCTARVSPERSSTARRGRAAIPEYLPRSRRGARHVPAPRRKCSTRIATSSRKAITVRNGSSHHLRARQASARLDIMYGTSRHRGTGSAT